MFIEILFKILLFKGGVLIYAEHCIYKCFFFLLYKTEENIKDSKSILYTSFKMAC